MRAVVFDGPAPDSSRTRVTELATPVPGPGQVLIRVDFAGINFKDVMMRRGDAGPSARWPMVPGLEVAGTVAMLGEGAGELEVGEAVVALTNVGGLADYAVAAAPLTVRVPPGLALADAASVPGVYATAELLLHDFARIRPEDTVVVYSASGSVGAAIAAVARAAGNCDLIGVVGSATRVDAARRAGYADVVVRGANLVEELRGAVGGGGADVVLDCQGTEYLAADLSVLAPTGRIVIFGNASGSPLAALPPVSDLFAGGAVGGFSLSELSHSAPDRVAGAIRRAMNRIIAGEVRPTIEVADGLDSAALLQQRLAVGSGSGKYVIRVG